MTSYSARPLVVGFILLGVAALALFAAPLWYSWHIAVDQGRVLRLEEETQHLAAIFDRQGPAGLSRYINERLALGLTNERFLLLADASLKPVASNLREWPREVPDTAGVHSVTLTVDGASMPGLFVLSDLPGGYHLLIGRSLATRLRPVETRFWYGLLGAMALFALVGIAGGHLIRRATLGRLEVLNQAIARISQGDLARRLPVGGRQDEFDVLLRGINGMLDQIEKLVVGMRDVSNAIAHDLRTPLTELRARLEDMASSDPERGAPKAEMEQAIADVDRVIALFNALLRLAKIDSGVGRADFSEVDLASAVVDAVEYLKPSAEQKGIRIVTSNSAPARVRGDPLLLVQAIANLVDNAIKFSPSGGAVSVDVRRDGNRMVEICVSDHGPGIPEAEKTKVTDRFFRGDASRGTPGVGLGLSLVSAIARLHSGSLQFADNGPGLRAMLAVADGG